MVQNGKIYYLVNAGTTVGNKANNNRFFTAGNKTKTHFWISLQYNEARFRRFFIVLITNWCLVRCRFIQMTVFKREKNRNKTENDENQEHYKLNEQKKNPIEKNNQTKLLGRKILFVANEQPE